MFDLDSCLCVYYLVFIIWCCKIFKCSGIMQVEMEKCGSDNVYGEGSGKLFFDLFVVMCNYFDDVIDVSNVWIFKMI